MGEAGNDNHDREMNRQAKIQSIHNNVEHYVSKLKELRHAYCRYQEVKADLELAGYQVASNGETVRVWKEIDVKDPTEKEFVGGQHP